MATGRITNEETFNEWYNAYQPNNPFADFDEIRKPLFMSGIQPLIMSGISNETLIVIEDFKAKIPANVPEREKRKRIDKYKSLLTQAFQEGNITYEQLTIWGNSVFDDLPVYGGNLVGVGSDGAEESTDQIKSVLGFDWGLGIAGDYNINKVEYFYGPVVDPNDLTGGVQKQFDTTYQFPLLRDFINAHVAIYGNREVGGLSKFFEMAFAGFVDTDFQTTEELVEESAVEGNLGAIDNAIKGTGESVALGEGKSLFELKQCALMSILYDPSKDLKNLASFTYSSEINVRDFKFKSYFNKNRIIPLYIPEDEKIEHLNNYFYSDENITKFFEQKNFSNKMRKELFYVYEDEEGQIKEVKLKKSSGLNDLNRSIDLLNAEIESTNPEDGAESSNRLRNLIEEKERIMQPEAQGEYIDQTDFKYYRLDNVDIEYNGTNPSTARDDVKVTLKFQLESFAGLNAVMADNISVFANPGKTSILLRDLVISPIDDDGKSNLTSALRNSYHPDRNRIRIKVQPEEWYDNRTLNSSDKYQHSPMILDLTTIDHEISRDESTGKISFSITYRGYMQSLMQMPFSDSLMTDGTVLRRKLRAENIKKVIDAGCSKETLRELLRVERNTTQNENTNNFGTIYSDLVKNRALKVAAFKDNDWENVLQDVTAAGLGGFVETIGTRTNTSPGFLKTSYGLSTRDRLETIAATGEDGSQGYNLGTIGKPLGLYSLASDNPSTTFVFLGDLLMSISKNLYANDHDDEMVEELSNKLRFVICPIDLPNPKSARGYTRINPIEIPVDMFFFAEWYHEVIVKKDLRTYPAAAFIRDLIERLVNNLLYETCIANLLPDEKPPLLRASYFSSTSDKDVSGFDLAKEYEMFLNDEMSTGGTLLSPKFGYLEGFNAPLFKRESDLDSYVPQPVYQTDYIVVYCVSPPYKRELASQEEGQLRDEQYIPTLINGTNTRSGVSMIHSLSFSKTTSPFLREARYFNNSFGSLALMNNVYDLSFKITDSAANTYLYPGMLLNIIVTDFEKTGDIDYKDASINEETISVADDFGVSYRSTDCDPHFRNSNDDQTTTAHILGIGGYFIIKSVSYNLGNSDRKFSIDVSCKFLGTEADKTVKRNAKDITTIISEDNAQCIESYNEAVKINQAAIREFNANKSEEQEERSSDFVTVAPPTAQNDNGENGTQQEPQAQE